MLLGAKAFNLLLKNGYNYQPSSEMLEIIPAALAFLQSGVENSNEPMTGSESWTKLEVEEESSSSMEESVSLDSDFGEESEEEGKLDESDQ